MSNDETRWAWAPAGVASAGTVTGVAVGAGIGMLIARAMGFTESVADYGPAFLFTVGAAWALALVGCYVALWLLRDSRTVPTVVVLAVLLPGSVLVVQPLGQVLADAFGWTFGLLIPLSVCLHISCVIGAPFAARLIAGFFPEGNRRSNAGIV